jgi:hypothetical protein
MPIQPISIGFVENWYEHPERSTAHDIHIGA